MAKKQKTFTVHVKADVFYEAIIPAETMREALVKARE